MPERRVREKKAGEDLRATFLERGLHFTLSLRLSHRKPIIKRVVCGWGNHVCN
jgi:hypothetical protein